MESVHGSEASPVNSNSVGNPGSPSLNLSYDSGSFRDRASRVFLRHGDIYRALTPQAQADWHRVSQLSFFKQLLSNGSVVRTRELSADEAAEFELSSSTAAILQHDRIPFVSYPYEWSFSMLRSAAILHLEILTEAIEVGTILKDSSPYNVQFRGTQPVFIDIGSFVAHGENEPWTGYRQFCELMLFPLLLQAYRQIDLQPILRSHLDGISASQFLRHLSLRDRFRPGVFTHGWLQSLLERQTNASQTDTVGGLKSSGFDRRLIQQNLRKLTALLQRLKWQPAATQWSHYRHELPHVVQDLEVKSSFVRGVCEKRPRSLAWDLGCNDGHFSRIAADHAAYVVAMDQDHGCVERLYRELGEKPVSSGNILPLRIDLLNPSPAQGWRGRERSRLEDRGRPDLVLCLGLIHHLVIAGNIPLPEVVDWLASLKAEIIIEFPSKRDPMVQGLLRNKPDQYDDYSLPVLESALQVCGLKIQSRAALPSGERTLLYVTP